ncbi:MAG: c-type cytochrome [Acidobacteria bacterium]|nr:c-type cytochrome [Acidobacteriota bacterium]
MLPLVALSLAAQSRDTNPHTSPADVAEGRRLYSLFCVFCHGMDGASGRGARLATTFRRHGTSDRDQYRVIANGVSGTEMSGHFLQEDEVWRILSFVRTLERGAPASPGACAVDAGSAVSGRRVFEQRGCLGCHSVGLEGSGRLGPDLGGIGAARPREALRESLVAPERAVAPAWRAVRVTLRDQSTVTGFLLNEDEYTVHMIDMSERARSFERRGISSMARQAGSTMPPYASVPPQELEHLLGYLCSLKGGSQ